MRNLITSAIFIFILNGTDAFGCCGGAPEINIKLVPYLLLGTFTVINWMSRKGR